MSEYYRIVNVSKRQFIRLSIFQSHKFYGIGRGLSGIIVSRLLTTVSPEINHIYNERYGEEGKDDLFVGAWIGDHVVFAGDYQDPEAYDSIMSLLPRNEGNIYEMTNVGLYKKEEKAIFENITDKVILWLLKDQLVHEIFYRLMENEGFKSYLQSLYEKTNDKNINALLKGETRE